MVNMNLLSNIYNLDNIEISNVNRKYLILIIIFIIIIILSLLITKDNYLENSFTVIDNKLLLVVDNENINVIKNSKEIIIKDIKYDYRIDKIERFDNNYLVTVNINNMINNINQGNYKIYSGKEKIVDYIIRIIKK